MRVRLCPRSLLRLEPVHIRVDRCLAGGKLRPPIGCFVLRQSGQKRFVVFMDELVAVADHEREGDPHANVAIGANDLVRKIRPAVRIAGKAWMDVLNRRRARFQHLDCRVERIEPVPDIPHAPELWQPELQRTIGHAKLERRQPGMVMAVDETRKRDRVRPAFDRKVRILGP